MQAVDNAATNTAKNARVRGVRCRHCLRSLGWGSCWKSKGLSSSSSLSRGSSAFIETAWGPSDGNKFAAASAVVIKTAQNNKKGRGCILEGKVFAHPCLYRQTQAIPGRQTTSRAAHYLLRMDGNAMRKPQIKKPLLPVAI